MLAETAVEAARRFGDASAFVAVANEDGGGPSLSYVDLDRRSDVVAAGMAACGVGMGDVVALALPPGLDYPVCYVAAAKLGAITAGINLRFAEEQRRHLVDLVQPALVVGDGGEAAGDLPLSDRQIRPAPTDPERPVAIVFTSGTTGTPKGAVFAGRQLAAVTAADVGDTWGAASGVRALAATSFSHLGFMTKLPGTLRRGLTTHVLRRWDAATALRLTARLGLRTVAGVPAQVALLLRRPEFTGTDLSDVQLVVMGGAPASPPLVRDARAGFGAPVVVRYSCTEAAMGTGTDPRDDPEDAERTVGRPRAGVDLAIRTADGADVPGGHVGEVLLRSPAAMDRYWRDPAATAATVTADGFVRTGDLGHVDGRGRLHLVGRSKEVYIRGGENVYPVAVEGVLAEHPGVAEVAVVPAHDDVMGEVGVAVVVPAAGRPAPDLDALRVFADGRLARHELPERLVLTDRLPLTPGDKVDRERLRDQAAAAGQDAGDAPTR